ncbi:hypothetical protein BK816_07730 [Boudabousia tangfeifanii]|uniref:N-acetyltransferase domain-containing protein n=1 Tax=Boudabousia tangfeifanii TaxID=1912795 RepID=A0A1D9MLT3_9ACTO|nr:GNAT family N-acetyltransferase [Boudabousia tangfeifanii]AOZ73198.1 hypothetical protein BK816_07730 [Boudabousia tangfeifanii]
MSFVLRTPTREEFSVRQAWLADPEMMSFNAGWPIDNDSYDRETGCFDWSEDRWDDWIERRLSLPGDVQGYFYVIDEGSGEPVGHAHYMVNGNWAEIGLNTVPRLRRQGIASQVLPLLLERVWRDTSVDFAMNLIEQSQQAAVALHEKFGFECSKEPYMVFEDKRSFLWLLPRPTKDFDQSRRLEWGRDLLLRVVPNAESWLDSTVSREREEGLAPGRWGGTLAEVAELGKRAAGVTGGSPTRMAVTSRWTDEQREELYVYEVKRFYGQIR